MKASTVGFAVVAAAQVLAAGAARAEGGTMPTAYPASNYHTGTAVAFAACVRARPPASSTSAVIQRRPLFKATTSEARGPDRTGADRRAPDLGACQREPTPRRRFHPLPGVGFEGFRELWKNGAAGDIDCSRAENLVYIYAVPLAAAELYTKKAVNSVADLKGVKFRSYSVATARIAELLRHDRCRSGGGSLPGALATGVADASSHVRFDGYRRQGVGMH